MRTRDINSRVVNNVELASELAHNAAGDEMVERGMINDRDEMWVPDDPEKPEEGTHYSSVAQDVFDRWYDYFYDEIQRYSRPYEDIIVVEVKNGLIDNDDSRIFVIDYDNHDDFSIPLEEDIYPEVAIKLLQRGYEVMVKPYDDDHENFTGITIADFEGQSDKEILAYLEEKEEIQFWSTAKA